MEKKNMIKTIMVVAVMYGVTLFGILLNVQAEDSKIQQNLLVTANECDQAEQEDEWQEAIIVDNSAENLQEELAVASLLPGVITGNGVNMRNKPSINGTVIASLYKGESVYVNLAKATGNYNGWKWIYVKRKSSGVTGYVSEKYVAVLN